MTLTEGEVGMMRHTTTILLGLILLIGAGDLFGQQAATLSGIVADSSDAVIPGVELRSVRQAWRLRAGR